MLEPEDKLAQLRRAARRTRDHRPPRGRRPGRRACSRRRASASTRSGSGAGSYFEKAPAAATRRPLRVRPPRTAQAIGFDDASIARILRKYKPQLVQVWADITLAAKEKLPGFFKVSPQAYFMDNVEKASRGDRTPPDWWYEHRKQEERREFETKRRTLDLAGESSNSGDEERAYEEYLQGEGRAAFAEIMGRLFRQYRDAGQTAGEAERNAAEAARSHLRNRFQREHPGTDPSGPTALGDILKRFKLSTDASPPGAEDGAKDH